MADNIAHAKMLFYSLYYDIVSLKSLKTTQAFHLLLAFAGNQIIFWDFKIRNSVRITESSDNGDSDNRGSTVYICITVEISNEIDDEHFHFDSVEKQRKYVTVFEKT